MNVNVYIEVEPGIRRFPRAAGFILELPIENKPPVTLTNVDFTTTETESGAQLEILLKALGRLKKKCNLTIYTQNQYLQGIERIEEWRKNNWQDSHKNTRPYARLWEKLEIALKPHSYRFVIGEHHSYKSWLEAEVKKEGRKQRHEKERESETVHTEG